MVKHVVTFHFNFQDTLCKGGLVGSNLDGIQFKWPSKTKANLPERIFEEDILNVVNMIDGDKAHM